MKKVDLLPSSLRTLRRARALLALSQIEPTTNHHVASITELTLNSVRKLMREYIKDDLVMEQHHLYRLTSKGRRNLQLVKADPYLIQYMEEENKLRQELELQRPDVQQL